MSISLAEHLPRLADKPHRLINDAPLEIDDPRGGVIRTRTTSRKGEWDGSDPQVVVGNGFITGIEMASRLARALTLRHGRVVTRYDDLRDGAAHKDPLGYRTETFGTVVDYCDLGSARPSTRLGCSTGSMAALDYERDRLTEDVDATRAHVMLLGPIGLTGSMRPEILALRGAYEIARTPTNPHLLPDLGRLALHTCGHVLRDLALCYKEEREIATVDERENVRWLRAHRVPVGVIALTKCAIHPIGKMREMVQQDGLVGDNYYEIKASHADMLSEYVSQQIHEAVRDLESSN